MSTYEASFDDQVDWFAVSQRNARSVQTTIGWIFWDPGAVERYRALGLPEGFASGLGYIAARCAPLASAGPDAVAAAFGSISRLGIDATFQLLGSTDRFLEFWKARDAAVLEGFRQFTPEILDPLTEFGEHLWAVVAQLPLVGRTFFASHLAMPRPTDPVLSGWHAINCIREWRGDTHWALVVGAGLTHPEASILHNAWLGYEPDWLAKSRGTQPVDIDRGWSTLEAKGLAENRRVNGEGVALRQRIEDETDRLCVLPWQILGAQRAYEFADRFELPCVTLLKRVDETAGPNYQPASRIR